MRKTAMDISSESLTPGIWLMPFAGTWNDPFFAERQSWFAKREDGTPFDTNWGGTCLDMTNPEVQAYLKANIERIVREWGYRYLKMDGLWTGSAADIQYVNDAYKDDQLGNSRLMNPNKTQIEALRDGLRLIRETAGREVFLLGCCAPQNMRSYGGAYGMVDAMRIGPDNGATVDGLLVGPRYGSRNYFMNGRVWWNDPDPVYVRTNLSLSQAELSCTWVGITGQLTVASDDLQVLPQERLHVLQRIMPTHRGWARPVDWLDRDMPRVWVAGSKGEQEARIVGLFNWDQERLKIDEPLERLDLDSKREYAGYEFWSNQFLPSITGRLQFELEPLGDGKFASAERSSGKMRRCCASLAIRPLEDRPQILSTSRHITQGLVDVVIEEWDGGKKELRGTSRVVGGDPYELRILTRALNAHWRVTGMKVSAEDEKAGVKIEEKAGEQGLARGTISSSDAREVKWSIQFRETERTP
ncbi:MAG: hypothetical protein U1D30_12805 [Planctomycetota bacterium]